MFWYAETPKYRFNLQASLLASRFELFYFCYNSGLLIRFFFIASVFLET